MYIIRGVTFLFALLMLTRVCFLATKTTSFNTIGNIKSVGQKFKLPRRFENKETVWQEYDRLAEQYGNKAIDLMSGNPDYNAPANVTNALAAVAKSDDPSLQQYTRISGHPRLVKAIAKLISKRFYRELDPNKEVFVTFGAFEALYVTLQGHTNPGDEWIIIEPFFDCYEPMVKTAGGIPRYIPLKLKSTSDIVTSGDWVFDRKEMKSLFNKKTKGIIINTPHNPTGKVFTLDELQFIADLAKKWNTLVVSDEVYETVVYKPNKHIRIASLPGMYERTITIGSANKMFIVTGWRTGWAWGPANLLHNLEVVHKNSLYACSTPIQEALAIEIELETERLGQPECFFDRLQMELLPKRDYMVKFLREIGMVPTIPEGGFFMFVNWSPLENKVRLMEESDEYKDYRFTKWMTKNVGLMGIPPSAFYGPKHKTLAEDYVRYSFIKKNETLKAADDVLKKWALE